MPGVRIGRLVIGGLGREDRTALQKSDAQTAARHDRRASRRHSVRTRAAMGDAKPVQMREKRR